MICYVRWVGGMVSIFPQSPDAVAFGVCWQTMLEGAFLIHSHCGSEWLNQLCVNDGSL